MAQFRAQPGVKYYSPSGHTVTFTAEQLKNEAFGWLADSYSTTPPQGVAEIPLNTGQSGTPPDTTATNNFSSIGLTQQQVMQIGKTSIGSNVVNTSNTPPPNSSKLTHNQADQYINLSRSLGFDVTPYITKLSDGSIYKSNDAPSTVDMEKGIIKPNEVGGQLQPGTTSPFDEQGNLQLPSGQRISPQDPNFEVLLKQQGLTRSVSELKTAQTGELTSQGVLIPNEEALQQRREELSKAGIPEGEWHKFISSPKPNDPRLFFRQPATLISPTGEKQIVPAGSEDANRLFKSGFRLGDTLDEDVISSSTMLMERPINVGDDIKSSTSRADIVLGGFNSTIKDAQDEIKRLQKLLVSEPLETETSKELDKLVASLDPDILTGRGEAQLAEEEKRGIEQKVQALNAKVSELRRKQDEINALTQSFNLANIQEEGRPQTLSRLKGAQAQNYRMYLAQKNVLTADAAFIQSDILALQNQLQAAQEAANRAVDLIYADREDRYKATIEKIRILEPQVEAEEQRYLTEVKLGLENQQAELAEAKSNLKEIQRLKLSYIEAVNNAGRQPDVKVLSSFSNVQSVDQAIDILGKSLPIETTEVKKTSSDGRRTPTDNPLSVNQIEQFRRSFGWTPPLGMSLETATVISNTNPDASPKELEEAAKLVQNHLNNGGTLDNLPDEIEVGDTIPQNTDQKTQPTLANRLTSQGLKERISQAKATGASTEQIKNAIKNAYTTDELKKLADDLGYSSFFTPKSMDINRMLNDLI